MARAVEDARPSSKRRPHIVMVIVDDAGLNDVGFSAGPDSPIVGKTPVTDALAAESVRLKEYYAHPVCTPTRAALLTGRYAVNVGMPFPLLAHAIAGLNTSVPTLPQVLRDDGGYKTHLVGKWHIGNAKRSMLPMSRGFDTFFGCVGGGFDHYTKYAGGTIDLWRGFEQVTDIDPHDHATNLFSREAVEIIHQHAQEHHGEEAAAPLFLYLAYTAPHDPLQADPEFIAKCADVPNRHRRTFCGMMAQLDAGIANVTQALKETGMWEDTIFVYSSDNGGNPIAAGFNYPYRGAKSTSWEGGSRVPGFIRAPERFGLRPRDFGGLVHVADWMPTLLSMAGLSFPQDKKTDGFDLTAAFQSSGVGLQDSPRQNVLIQHDVFMNATSYRSGCMKIHLGCPGMRSLYLEPDHRLLRLGIEPEVKYTEAAVEKMSGLLTEKGFDLIESYIKPPLDQFIKYTLTIELIRLHDFLTSTSYSHFLNTRYQNLSLWKADLKDHPPVLDWDTKYGPKILLFDLCQDPKETRNLAFAGPERISQVQRLYEDILAATSDAPVQFAGDTIVRLPTDDPKKRFIGQRLKTFLDEEDDLTTLTVVKDRMFSMFHKVLCNLFFFFLSVVAVLTVLGTCGATAFVKVWQRRRKARAAAKAAGVPYVPSPHEGKAKAS